MAVTANVGRLQTGKTTLTYKLAQQRRKRIIWDGKVSTSNFKPSDGRVIYGFGGKSIDSFPGLALAWSEAPEIIIKPPRGNGADTWEWFAAQLATHLETHTADEYAVIVDEFGQVNRNWPYDDFEWFVKSVPINDVDIYFSTHKPVEVHSRYRSIVGTWCLFQVVDDADLAMLRRRGVPADVLAQLPTLPPRAFYEWNESQGRGALVTNSAKWYTPLTHPPMPAWRRRYQELLAVG